MLSAAAEVKHLYVLISQENPGPRNLLVSVTSIREGVFYDDACVINAGEHPFIKHPSYVYYNEPINAGRRHIEKQTEAGSWIRREDVSDELFSRITDGLTKSDFSPPWAIEFFARYG